MPSLENAQHEKFVQELVKGRSQADAYLAAGYKAKDSAVAAASGCRLLKNEKIAQRLEELNKFVESAVVDDTLLTLSEHMAMLRLLRDEARLEGKLQAAIQAEVKRGELRKFYVKQIESGNVGDFDRMSEQELYDFIALDTAEQTAPAPAKGGKRTTLN